VSGVKNPAQFFVACYPAIVLVRQNHWLFGINQPKQNRRGQILGFNRFRDK
jgi:hypothetical protein